MSWVRFWEKACKGLLVEDRPPTQADVTKAVAIFDLKPGEDLQKKFKELAIKNHPDRGGDVEKMKQVNWAHDVLERVGMTVGGAQTFKSQFDPVEYDRKSKQDTEDNSQMMSELADKAKIAAPDFVGHFAKFYPVQLVSITPKGTQYGGWVVLVFASPDKKARFEITISFNKSSQPTRGLPGEGAKDYSVVYTTFVYFNERKYKMSQSNYAWTADHGKILTPESIFPASKLKKVFSDAGKERKMSKRDFEAVLKSEFDAKFDKDFAVLNVGDGVTMEMNRSVMMRMPLWTLRSVADKKNNRLNILFSLSHSMYLPENEIGLGFVREVIEIVKGGGGAPDVERAWKKMETKWKDAEKNESVDGFDGFDDPWKAMSQEDRREANRLLIAALKAYPSSPRQNALHKKLNVILKKYGIVGKKDSSDEMSVEGSAVIIGGMALEWAELPFGKGQALEEAAAQDHWEDNDWTANDFDVEEEDQSFDHAFGRESQKSGVATVRGIATEIDPDVDADAVKALKPGDLIKITSMDFDQRQGEWSLKVSRKNPVTVKVKKVTLRGDVLDLDIVPEEIDLEI